MKTVLAVLGVGFMLVMLATLLLFCYVLAFGDFYNQQTWDVTVVSAPDLPVGDMYVIVQKSDGTLVHLENSYTFADRSKDAAILQSQLIPGEKYRIKVGGIEWGRYLNILSATRIE